MSVAYEKMIEERPATLKAYLSWSVSFNPDLRPQYLATRSHILELIKTSMPAPLDNETDALIIYNAANMMAVMKFDKTPRDVMVKFILRFIRELDDKRLEQTSDQNLASYLRVWVLKSVMTEQ